VNALPKRRLPLLDLVMRLGKLSNEDVAKVSGVSARTIAEVRRKKGNPIRSDYAGFIEEAVLRIVKREGIGK